MQKVLSSGIAMQFTSTVIVNFSVAPQTAVGKEKYLLLTPLQRLFYITLQGEENNSKGCAHARKFPFNTMQFKLLPQKCFFKKYLQVVEN